MSLMREIVGRNLLKNFTRFLIPQSRPMSKPAEDNDEIACRFECYFSRSDLDGWELRQGINDLMGYDFVPEPPVIIAALKACRKVNDYALTVRLLEAVKDKCGGQVDKIYPYIVQEIAPVLCELGCDVPENLCYHRPELWLQDADDM